MRANSIFNILEGQDVLMLAEGLNIFNHKISKSLAGKTLIQSDIRQKTGCTVIAIKKDDEMAINPAPDTILSEGQEIILIGQFEGESAFNSLYISKSND